MIKYQESTMARIIQANEGTSPKQFILNDASSIIGRASSSTIHLPAPVVSSQHAEIIIETNAKGEEIFFIQDLKSKNGCYVNKKKISCKQLHDKDRIRIGSYQFTFII